jgi:protocatechuate 3,4-dioxygenase beta subunit
MGDMHDETDHESGDRPGTSRQGDRPDTSQEPRTTHASWSDRPATFRSPTTRRRALALLGGGGLSALAIAACGTSTSSGADATTSTTSAPDATTSGVGTAGGASACTTLPEETAGPYPADGTNGPNVLTTDGVVRRDITTSFGGLSGTADGVPLDIELTVVDTGAGCAPLAGAAVYLWHCDAVGDYSLYSPGLEDQNHLRGVQVADDDGRLGFTSIFPGCYPGRWPHIHFEVYETLSAATSGRNAILTSQIALPERTSGQVYVAGDYDGSEQNLSRISLASDNVFSDGAEAQTPTVSGDAAAGYTITLTVGV